jgi:hypothetical protein
MAFAVGLLAGCGSPMKRAPELENYARVHSAQAPESSRVPVVVVRWPAEVEPTLKARWQVRLAHVSELRGSTYESIHRALPLWWRQSPYMLDETLLKSGYYAAELVKALKQTVGPKMIVAMQPATVAEVDGITTLTFPTGEIRGAVYVDFTAWSDPLTPLDKNWSSDEVTHSTYADALLPVLSVHTDPALAPVSQGALLGHDVIPLRKQPTILGGGLRANMWTYWASSLTDAKGSDYTGPTLRTVGCKKDTYTMLPLAFVRLRQMPDGELDSKPVMQSIARLVADCAATVDTDRAYQLERARLARQLDVERVTAALPADRAARASRLLDVMLAAETQAAVELTDRLISALNDPPVGQIERSLRRREREHIQRMQVVGNQLEVENSKNAALSAIPVVGFFMAVANSQKDIRRASAEAEGLTEADFAGLPGVIEKASRVRVVLTEQGETRQVRNIGELRHRLHDAFRKTMSVPSP